MMTRRERMARDQVAKVMSEEGYPTYAEIFSLFDLHLTKDPGVIGYMIPGEAVIVLNEGLDIEQVSMVVRHEILHEFLEHGKREKKHGIPGSDHQLSNMAADYEISNLGYTSRDKTIARSLLLNGEIMQGLVTDIDHPDWIDKSYEEMYDLLKKESPESIKPPQVMIGDRGDSTTQQAEDTLRRAEVTKEKLNNDENSSSNGPQQQSDDQEDDSDSGSSDGQKQQERGSSSGKGQKKRPSYNDEEYKNMSPEEKKKERARRRKELNKQVDDLMDELKDTLGEKKDEEQKGQVFEDPEDKKDRQQRIAKIREILGNIGKKNRIFQESNEKIYKERAAKRAKDAAKWNTNSLNRFTQSLNKFIKDAIAEGEEDSWAKINRRYVYSGLLRPGRTSVGRNNVPKINVYFDRSGSWDANKTKQGAQCISTLNRYVIRREIELHLYYFNDRVFSQDSTDGSGFGGTCGRPIMEHIKQTQPNNVIILTDGDISDIRSPVSVPGAVWMLFYGARSQNLIDNLSGKQLTQYFDINE